MAWLDTVMGGAKPTNGEKGWLNKTMGGLNSALGGQGLALSEILSLFGANQAINKYNVATPSENASLALYQAMLNPNSPQMKTLTAQSREQGLADFQNQIREMQLADRRERAMGRSNTFFNPERADEQVSYLTSRGLPNINSMAQNNALQMIANAAKGISGFKGDQRMRMDIDENNMVSEFALPAQFFKQYLSGGFDPINRIKR